MPFHRVRLRLSAADEHAEQHAGHVGVENGGALPEREAHHRARGVLADPFERSQRCFVGRQAAAVALNRLARDCVQPPRTNVVAQRPPRLRDVFLRRRGERFQAGILVQPLVILRQHAIDLRLLQHHFGDEDVVRIGRPAPGQVASIAPIPVEKPPPKPLPFRRARKRTFYNSQAVKIYTKTGDTGETGLYGGVRVSKADARVVAYGEVDELNASLGLARAMLLEVDGAASLPSMLEQIQRDLFALGARLADPRHQIAERVTKAAVGSDDIGRLEGWIDELEAALPPLRRFILPGGSVAGAALHVARTACRRAERAMVALLGLDPQAFEPELLVYVNRLSDLLFVMARSANQHAGTPEIEW